MHARTGQLTCCVVLQRSQQLTVQMTTVLLLLPVTGVDLEAAKYVYGPSTECNTPCAGDATQFCGGAASARMVRHRAPACALCSSLQGMVGSAKLLARLCLQHISPPASHSNNCAMLLYDQVLHCSVTYVCHSTKQTRQSQHPAATPLPPCKAAMLMEWVVTGA